MFPERRLFSRRPTRRATLLVARAASSSDAFHRRSAGSEIGVGSVEYGVEPGTPNPQPPTPNRLTGATIASDDDVARMRYDQYPARPGRLEPLQCGNTKPPFICFAVTFCDKTVVRGERRAKRAEEPSGHSGTLRRRVESRKQRPSASGTCA